MLKIAVCDDENAVCREVGGILHSRKEKYEVTLYASGMKLLTAPDEYDVVILDIEMPEIDGMSAAATLRDRNKNTYILFLTNHEEVMREAFAVRAFRFFSKPVNPAELYGALTEIEREIYCSVKLSVFSGGVHSVVRLSDIVYFEAYGDGTYIFTKNNIYDTKNQLVYWNRLLEGRGFFQVNRTIIVAVDKIDSYTCRTVTVRDMEFSLSRLRIKGFNAVMEKGMIAKW